MDRFPAVPEVGPHVGQYRGVGGVEVAGADGVGAQRGKPRAQHVHLRVPFGVVDRAQVSDDVLDRLPAEAELRPKKASFHLKTADTILAEARAAIGQNAPMSAQARSAVLPH